MMQRGQTKPAQQDDEVEKPIDYEHGQTGRTEFKKKGEQRDLHPGPTMTPSYEVLQKHLFLKALGLKTLLVGDTSVVAERPAVDGEQACSSYDGSYESGTNPTLLIKECEVNEKRDDIIHKLKSTGEAILKTKWALQAGGKWTNQIESRWKRKVAEEKKLTKAYERNRKEIERQERSKFFARRSEELAEFEGDLKNYNLISKWKVIWKYFSTSFLYHLDNEYAIKMQDVWKRYGMDLKTLRALNMAVDPGPVESKTEDGKLGEKQQQFDRAWQDSSQFKDKLDGTPIAVEGTADQVNNFDSTSALPTNIRDYLSLDQTEQIISVESFNKDDLATISEKAGAMTETEENVSKVSSDSLNLLKFWKQRQTVSQKLDSLLKTISVQIPPAFERTAIQKQQDQLEVIKKDIDKTKPELGQVRQTGQNLMRIYGEQDKTEIKKNIEDLDSTWDNINELLAKREENLIDATQKAMEFHETLQNLLTFLDRSDERLANFEAIGADIDAVKKQITDLKDFYSEVDPNVVKVEAMSRQAGLLIQRTSPDQIIKIKGILCEVDRRWGNLLKAIVERQRELENALLRLGQFQHALQELMTWIEKTNKSLDSLQPVFGDPQVIEVELAKLKVIMNDIQAHQNSVDTLNDAGRQIIESEKGSENASKTQQKLNDLNNKWNDLQAKANGKHKELEDALREAQLFNQEIQDFLLWLGQVDSAISSSKPTGGLPETATEQLARFMEIYNELEANRPKVEAVLHQGQEYLKKSNDGAATNLQHNLRTLRQRWESVMNRANDKKIKLEIALKEANEFHKSVQDFTHWLTEAERYLISLEPISPVLPKVMKQIETHNEFQREASAQLKVMISLEKKGKHLKHFSPIQDFILMKDLDISVQRAEKIGSKSKERTHDLDLGQEKAKEFHDTWTNLCRWLDEAEKNLDEMSASAGNNPIKIKQILAKQKEFQKQLSAKQPIYDNTMKKGKNLKGKAPKSDEPIIGQMLTDLKNKWSSVCNKSVERQRNLEQDPLTLDQFNDDFRKLLDWLRHEEFLVIYDEPVDGDLGTVLELTLQHKQMGDELQNRRPQIEDMVQSAGKMMESASPEEKDRLRGNLHELKELLESTKRKYYTGSCRLEDALNEAKKLDKAVQMLMEYLYDAVMKLSDSSPICEESTRKILEEHETFLCELKVKEREKDDTIDQAKCILLKANPDAVNVIKHWISIIQSAWDLILSTVEQRAYKVKAYLASLRDSEVASKETQLLPMQEVIDLPLGEEQDEIDIAEDTKIAGNEFMQTSDSYSTLSSVPVRHRSEVRVPQVPLVDPDFRRYKKDFKLKQVKIVLYDVRKQKRDMQVGDQVHRKLIQEELNRKKGSVWKKPNIKTPMRQKKSVSEPKNPPKIFPCSQCERKFLTKKAYKNHDRIDYILQLRVDCWNFTFLRL